MHPRVVEVLILLGAVPFSGCVTDHGIDHSECHGWKEEPHHLSVLFGSTKVIDGESGPTVGLDYEYRLNERIGVGAVVEHAGDELDATTVLGVADIHITPHWIVQTGPGLEFLDSEEEFVYRVGALYEFERDSYTISPQLHYDGTAGEDSLVFALAFGWGF